MGAHEYRQQLEAALDELNVTAGALLDMIDEKDLDTTQRWLVGRAKSARERATYLLRDQPSDIF